MQKFLVHNLRICTSTLNSFLIKIPPLREVRYTLSDLFFFLVRSGFANGLGAAGDVSALGGPARRLGRPGLLSRYHFLK